MHKITKILDKFHVVKPSKLSKIIPDEGTKETKDEVQPIITHTTFGLKSGSYSIPDKELPKLYDAIITNSYEHNEYLTIVERPIFNTDGQCYKPIVIDIDFRFDLENNKRQYTNNHIIAIVELFNNTIRKYLNNVSDMKTYVFERPTPYKDKGNIKDGIHIIYPEIITSTKVQFLIRKEVCTNFMSIINNPSIGKINVKNNIEDIVDKSIIEQNGWILYGCGKQNCDKYELTCIYLNKYVEEKSEYILTTIENTKSHRELIEYLSIRKKYVPTELYTIKDEYKELLDEFIIKKKKTTQLTDIDEKLLKLNGVNNMNDKRINCTMTPAEQTAIVEEATALTKILSIRRASEYNSWFEVGCCLFNISPTLKSTFMEFSAKATHKFNAKACADTWDKFCNGNLTIGSLHLWANIDNPTEYREIRSKFLSTYLLRSLSLSSADMCKVLYAMYKHKFVCVSSKDKVWYEFKNHRWHEASDGISLRNNIDLHVINEYLKLSMSYTKIALDDKTPEHEREDALRKTNEINAAIFKLKDVTFKNKIMDEARGMFYRTNFVDLFDSNKYLLGFENGVYDLNAQIFRDGRPEDMITLSTKCDFPESEFNEDSEEAEELMEFFNNVFPNPDTRYFALKLFASFIDGHNPDEAFYIFTGGGGNGKSKLVELFSSVIGDYSGKVSVSYITQKRNSSSSASPEIIRLVGRRLVVFQEPTGKDEFNVGIIKEITGNDTMSCRGLYGSSKDIKLQTKWAICCNTLPKIDARDDGTWRRMKVLPFLAKFVDHPDPANKYEFRKDIYLSEKMNTWKECFMALLLKYYKLYVNEGLSLNIPVLDADGNYTYDSHGKVITRVPDEVERATSEYKKDSNYYVQFKDDCLVKSEGSSILFDDMYDAFKTWYISNQNTTKVPNRKEFKAEFDKCFNIKLENKGCKVAYHGLKIKEDDVKSDLKENLFASETSKSDM